MRKDVEAVWKPLQDELLRNQKSIEEKAKRIYGEDPAAVRKFLTEYCIKQGKRVVEMCWRLGDFLWTKYDEKF